MKNQIVNTLLLFLFLFIFACKGLEGSNVGEDGNKKGEKEKVKIYFLVSPFGKASITASVDGKPITSGEKVEKGKEIVFLLSIKNEDEYKLDFWEGADKDDKNPLKALKKVVEESTVIAKLTTKKKETEVPLIFFAEPKELGEVSATCEGVAIESGKGKVTIGKKVEFTLKLKDSEHYELYSWQGAKKDDLDPLKATLEVKEETNVVAIISKKKGCGKVTCDSLVVCNKKVDIQDVENMKVEVDNVVDYIEAKDIIAMFFYKDDQEVPEALPIQVDRDKLDLGENVVNIEVEEVEGVHKGWKGKITIDRKNASVQEPISSNIRVSEIGTFLVDEKRKYGDVIILENFDSQNAGPYRMKDAKTAYCAIRVKLEKPSATDDYEVYFENKNTYTPIYKAKRMEGENFDYFVSSGIVLSKGFNILEVTVKTPDKKDVGVYKVVTKYAGGPDQSGLNAKKRKMLPGWYCPANRRPLDGELPDYVWGIGIAGYCMYCSEPLNRAGKVGRIAEKYSGKGLRVIAIDVQGGVPDGCVHKWREAGANYPLYDRVWNDFMSFYEAAPKGYPRNLVIKKGNATMLYNGVEAEIRQFFGF